MEQVAQSETASDIETLSKQQQGNVVWYIQTGTLKGTVEQTDDMAGIVKGFVTLYQEEPWAAVGELVYASKQGYSSENPYLIPLLTISSIIRQAMGDVQQPTSEPTITHTVGGIM